MATVPERQIRARRTDRGLIVYQAYNDAIADAALAAQTFVAPFSFSRMTWIKPSFLWIAGRSGWASKPAQERVLAVEITESGFWWALEHACLSHLDPEVHESEDAWRSALAASPVRVQWDPERTIRLGHEPFRSIQVGLSGEAVRRYADEWIVSITDVTDVQREIGALVAAGRVDEAAAALPAETVVDPPHPLPDIRLVRSPVNRSVG